MSRLDRVPRIAWFAILCMTLMELSASALCVPSFPYADGWMGGDRGYSIPLEAQRDLWLFGDSFVRTDLRRSRAGSMMIYNAAGISSCRANKWSIRYYYRKSATSGLPAAFFDAGTDKYRLWPLDGFIRDGKLYIFLVEIATTGGGAFDFKAVGANLAEVTNPADEPNRWKIEYHDLKLQAGIVPGVAAFVADGYAYFYAVADRIAREKHQVIFARIPLGDLDSPAANLEYFAKGRSWKGGLNQFDAEVVMENAAPEFSVRYHPGISRWMMVETDSAFPPTLIGIRTASRPEGPWSSFRSIYRISDTRGPQAEGVICYEAREHPELSSDFFSSITYVCSSQSFSRQLEDLSLYRPRAIFLPLR